MGGRGQYSNPEYRLARQKSIKSDLNKLIDFSFRSQGKETKERQLTSMEISVLKDIKEFIQSQRSLGDMSFREIIFSNEPNDNKSLKVGVKWVKSPTGKSLIPRKAIIINTARLKNREMFEEGLPYVSIHSTLREYNKAKIKPKKANSKPSYLKSKASHNATKNKFKQTQKSMGRYNHNTPNKKVKLPFMGEHKAMTGNLHSSKKQLVGRISKKVREDKWVSDKQDELMRDYLYGGKKK